jgi:hypothetical protein
MAKQIDPMEEMLKGIKKQIRAQKDAETASKAFADELGNGKRKTDALTESVAASTAATFDQKGASDALKESMGAAKSMGGALGKTLGTIAKVGQVAMAGLGPIGAVIGSLSGALTAPIDAIKEMADAIIQLVGLANPGAVQQFTLALNDAMAVIGGAMTPMLEGMTIAMRTVGDTLAGMMPVLQPLFDQLGQSIANWAVGFRQIWEAAAPLIDMLVVGLVETLKDVSVAVATFQGALVELLHTLTMMLGIDRGKFNKDASSQGAAVRNFKVSSVDQFSKDLFAKQLSVIGKGGQGRTPDQNIAEIREAIVKGQAIMIEIRDLLKLIWDFINGTLKGIMGDSAAGGLKQGVTGGLGGNGGLGGLIGGMLGKAFIK